MWQRMTAAARRVVFHSQQEAAELGQQSVAAEHLFLGLVREGDPVIMNALSELGAPADGLHEEVRRQLRRGGGLDSNAMRLTESGKRVIDAAYEESRWANQQHLGAEHLLLGILTEGKSPAARVLAAHGVDAERLRRLLLPRGEVRPAAAPEGRGDESSPAAEIQDSE